MSLGQSLLPEFDHEMANTRKALERVPEGKYNWKPHEKSGSLGWLAGHLAHLPAWAAFTLSSESLDIGAAEAESMRPPQPKDGAELLEFFDQNVAAARKALAEASDADFMKNWTLSAGGKKVFTMPRFAVLRGMVFSHIIHHRGQLTVYLRLLDVPVPSLYGSSADEPGM